MPLNLTQKLIESHLADGEMQPGALVGLSIDQTLTQDATGTLVMLALEAMKLDRVRTDVSVQYVDHNLVQEDHRNPDDHLFLESAAKRFGLWFSRPGNGVSHPLHMSYFGKPGATLLGSDSHTPAAGSLGMLAFGAGGLDVAMAMAGKPYYLKMPEIWGVRLVGTLPDWVSAKDVILEMLRRHGVDGGHGRIVEYYGPGLACLTAMDRHVIANMGTELGATTTVLPADEEVKEFLRLCGREGDFGTYAADEDATYDIDEEIDLSALEPLIAKPSSPGNVVPVTEVAGEEIYQAYIGSSANPGYRDFAVPAAMVRDRRVPDGVSFDINPTTRELMAHLSRSGFLVCLLDAGARFHQAGCNGCIGMGQAPATGRNSLRTVPRNFPGRSGTSEDSVFLCSPETATVSALYGRITDPRKMDMPYPQIRTPDALSTKRDIFLAPLPQDEARHIELVRGPNIAALPQLDELPDKLALPVLLKIGDDLSTDEIMPAGAEVLPFRSNIEAISEFVFRDVEPSYAHSAREIRAKGGHVIIGGVNYGQGSSREHAALAPRYLGLRVVIVKSFARIHRQNLINYGIVPLTFADTEDYDLISAGDTIEISELRETVANADTVNLTVCKDDRRYAVTTRLDLLDRERKVLLDGGLMNWIRREAE